LRKNNSNVRAVQPKLVAVIGKHGTPLALGLSVQQIVVSDSVGTANLMC
jgi:hypothetical protein